MPGKDKMRKVMGEYKRGTLRSGKPGPGKGKKVTSRKQAIAIAMSEAGMSKAIDKGIRKAVKKDY